MMTNFNCSDRILLTGAGFTHNFGTPLADEFWCDIFNNKIIQNYPKLRCLMLSFQDYEKVYQIVQSDPKYSDEEKNAMQEALNNAYINLDNIIRECSFTPDSPINIDIYGVEKFINNFFQQGSKSFIFTLNQDLFIERHYINGESLFPLGLSDHKSIFNSGDRKSIKIDKFIKLPIKEEIDFTSYIEKSNFFYIKLHGSHNWEKSDGSLQIIVGKNKINEIEEEPLLHLYLELFKKVLNYEKKKLLIIGYSFRDSHINKIITDAIDNSKLKIYVISPESISLFKSNLHKQDLGARIYNNISGYFQYSLKQIFPADKSISQYYNNIYSNYFIS